MEDIQWPLSPAAFIKPIDKMKPCLHLSSTGTTATAIATALTSPLTSPIPSPSIFSSSFGEVKSTSTGTEAEQSDNGNGVLVTRKRAKSVRWAPDVKSPKHTPKDYMNFGVRREEEDEFDVVLLERGELEEWQLKEYAGDYLETGHRPVTGSVLDSILSLMYLHNEFVNIHTHLLAATIFLFLPIYMFTLPYVTTKDIIVCSIYFLGTSACFFFSATFHTLLNHSAHVYHSLLNLDLLGIVLLMYTSTIPQIHYLFACHPPSSASPSSSTTSPFSAILSHASPISSLLSSPKNFYHSLLFLCSALCTLVTLHPAFRNPLYRGVRACTFALLGVATCVPVLHAFVLYRSDVQENVYARTGFYYWIATVTFNAVGAGVYGVKFPEKFFPRRFDLFGASHQVLHVMVVLAAVAHTMGLMQMLDWVKGRGGVCSS